MQLEISIFRDFKSIIKINHQSGDFHPDSSSLVWPLTIMARMRAPLADRLLVEESGLTDQGIFRVTALHQVTKTDLQKILPAAFPEHVAKINCSAHIRVNPPQKQEKPKEEHGQKAKYPRSIFDGPSNVRRRLDLGTVERPADLTPGASPAMSSTNYRTAPINFGSGFAGHAMFFHKTLASTVPASASMPNAASNPEIQEDQEGSMLGQ